MKPWFDDDKKREKLRQRAYAWLGTPFMTNSESPGPFGGVSCQKLVGAIYRECGFCDVVVDEVPMSYANYGATESLVVPFMEKLAQFKRIEDFRVPLEGDLLGFEIGNIIHHLGIVVNDPRHFVAVGVGRPVCIRSLSGDPVWSSRLRAVWRPVYV